MHLVPVPAEDARKWALYSLEQGAEISQFMRSRIQAPISAVLLAPRELDLASLKSDGGSLLDDRSRGISRADSEIELERVLQERQARLVVVEDDLGGREDPGLRGPRPAGFEGGLSFIGDRVIHWSERGADAAAMVRLMRWGSSAYPLNAFLCDENARRHLGPDQEIAPLGCAEIVESVRMVIHSIYDAESFLIIEFEQSKRMGTRSHAHR